MVLMLLSIVAGGFEYCDIKSNSFMLKERKLLCLEF